MDMMKMFGKIKEVQGKLKEAQDNLLHLSVTGEAGGGMVKATVNGNKQIVKLDISDTVFETKDKNILTDLIIAAVNKAMEEIEIKTKEELQKSTQGMLPNIPGFNFGATE